MNLINFISKELIVVFTGMLPVLELRGAIPLGISMGMNPWHAAVLGIIGATIPVPFILLLLRPILFSFEKSKWGTKISIWIKKHITGQNTKIGRYRKIGLFIFVAIPLPTTGAWTGAGFAALMDMKIIDSLLYIFLGNCCAAIIMMILSDIFLNVVT